MPDNPYYTTQKWKNLKKKQIFYQQNDGLPVYLKRGYPYMYIYWVIGALTLYTGYYAIAGILVYVYPKRKKN